MIVNIQILQMILGVTVLVEHNFGALEGYESPGRRFGLICDIFSSAV